MADLRMGKELLSLGSGEGRGGGGSLASRLETLWQSFSEAKLLQTSQFTGLTKTTPFRPKEFPIPLVATGNDLVSENIPSNPISSADDNNNSTNEAQIIEKEEEKESTELPATAAPGQSDEKETHNEEESGGRNEETEEFK
jgi:hypothetical protein